MRKKAELKGFDPGPLHILQERKSLGEHVFDNLKQAISRESVERQSERQSTSWSASGSLNGSRGADLLSWA
jgi:hypothetical protein